VREVARARQTLPVQQRYGQHHGQHGGLPAPPRKLRRDVVFVARSRSRTEAARAVQRTWRRACQVTRLRHVRLVAHVLQAQWWRRAATRFGAAGRRQQENTAQDTPSILLEDAEMCHVRLVARAGAARAVQRSWRRACQVARLGQVRLVALGLQAQWRRRAATRIVALRRRQGGTGRDVPSYVSRGVRRKCAGYYPLRRKQANTALHVRQQMTTAQVMEPESEVQLESPSEPMSI